MEEEVEGEEVEKEVVSVAVLKAGKVAEAGRLVKDVILSLDDARTFF